MVRSPLAASELPGTGSYLSGRTMTALRNRSELWLISLNVLTILPHIPGFSARACLGGSSGPPSSTARLRRWHETSPRCLRRSPTRARSSTATRIRTDGRAVQQCKNGFAGMNVAQLFLASRHLQVPRLGPCCQFFVSRRQRFFRQAAISYIFRTEDKIWPGLGAIGGLQLPERILSVALLVVWGGGLGCTQKRDTATHCGGTRFFVVCRM